MKQGLLVFLLLSWSALSFSYPIVPDAQYTTGDLCTTENPDFKEYRYSEHIVYCARNVSSSTKTHIYDNYQIPKNCRSRYTIDHFIPLSIGGSNETLNLWPEHKLVKATRPDLEQELYEQLKAGKITQKDAIDEITAVKTTPILNFDLETTLNDCDIKDQN